MPDDDWARKPGEKFPGIGKAAQTRRGCDIIYRRATFDQGLRRIDVTEDESGHQGRAPSSLPLLAERGAEIEQGIDKRYLYAGVGRMTTGNQ